MKIQYVSDLHLEFDENSRFFNKLDWKVTGDILVIAGDLAYIDQYPKKFLNKLSEKYQAIIIVPGNHEYYHYQDVLNYPKEDTVYKNIHILNNAVITFDDIAFIGTTLWSNILPGEAYFVERGMNDFKRIRYGDKILTAENYNELHKEAVKFIEDSLEHYKDYKKVVITHHVPSYQLMNDIHKTSIINSGFNSNLDELVGKADLWIYGHNHYNSDKEINGTPCISNQFGYMIENNEWFDHKKFIEI